LTNKLFFALVRRYAQLAQRMRRSYADQVAEVYQMRQAAVSTSDLGDEAKRQLLSQNADFVDREYGSIDSSWVTPQA